MNYSSFFTTQASKILITLLIIASLTRLFNLGYPQKYVFDEVYHAFTAKEYVKGNKDAWNPWATPPKGVAFEWTHPPLAKEIMASSMIIFNSLDSWAWRLPGTLLGIVCIYLVYLLGNNLFKNKVVGLLSAFVFAFDGLNFVQSRTGMNDIYLITFILSSLLLFLNKRYFLSAIFFGFALASKWTAIYLLGVYLIFLIKDQKLNKLFYFLVVTSIIYLISYIPYFLLGYNFNQFWQLQQQMWGYHTGLKATHDYASAWWSWPLNLYPVWFFVDYKNNQISNIFTTGNPVVFWLGAASLLLTIWGFVKRVTWQGWQSILSFLENQKSLLIILLGYFVFFLPWAFSPRIMFLYHYLPSTPFLSLALGYQLNEILKQKNGGLQVLTILGLIVLGFIFIYPFMTGIFLPKNLVELFFLTNLTRNPF